MKRVNMHDLDQSIIPLVQKGTLLKVAIIKNKVLSKTIENDTITTFKTTLDNFLNQWTSYANEAKDALPAMRKISTENEFTVIDYNFAKDFIFSSYDYNSIKDFVDGIVLGLNDNKIKKVNDVVNFFRHTVGMAFDTQSESIGELVESRSDRTMSMYSAKVAMYDIKMFNSARTYHMFENEDKIYLYKAVTMVIDSLTKTNQPKDLFDAMERFSNNYDASKMWISIINNIVDYAVYSAVAYATRIYVLLKYIGRFEQNLITESAEQKEYVLGIDPYDIMENINPGPFSNIWQSMDGIVIKDPDNARKFFDKYREFLSLLGVAPDKIPDESYFYIPDKLLDNNILYGHVKNNELASIINDAYFLPDDASFGNPKNFEEFNHNLKGATTNSLQGLAGTSNPKNELMHLIRKNDYYGNKFAIPIYKKMAEELYYVSMTIVRNTFRVMERIRFLANGVSSSDSNPYFRPPISNNFTNMYTDKKQLNECLYILIGFYEEFIFTVSQKMNYIEASVNNLYAIQKREMSDKLTLADPFTLFNDATLFSTTMVSVPETLRIPIEAQDLFTLTSFEEACLMDEMLKSTPGFENNMYLSEAGVSNVMNMILSLIQGLINSASIFFFKNFKPASDWVSKNKETLLKINFSKDDKITNVYNYNMDIKSDGSINGISITKLVDTLENVNKDEVLKDVDKWVKSLYPSDEIYNWFTTDAKTAAIKYQNKVLFNVVTDKPVAPVELSGNELKKEFDIWVNDMLHAGTIANMLVKAGKEMDQAIKAMKSKAIVEYALLEADGNVGNAPEVTPDGKNPSAGSNDGKNAKTGEVKVEIKGASATTIPLDKITEVITRTWKPLYDGVLQIFRDEYKNVKAIYQQSLSTSADNKTADQTQQNQK